MMGVEYIILNGKIEEEKVVNKIIDYCCKVVEENMGVE
jgi:hypothetical protein